MYGRDRYRKFAKCEAECTEHSIHRADGTPIDASNNPLDDESKPILTCIKMIPVGGRSMTFNVCGKKLKGDAEFPHLCGLHIGVITRGRNKNALESNLKARANAELEAFKDRVDALNQRYELSALADTRSGTTGPLAFVARSTGRVVISLDRLEALLAKLDET